ncbi:hypothetical protein GCM10022419_058410 [Nonomuraea rosea]|uniref:Uncharacterized protein n=1 Tax=Nonomuraea rosea TaxID=638574 RepID=A0ABP6XPZ0_9ACTN
MTPEGSGWPFGVIRALRTFVAQFVTACRTTAPEEQIEPPSREYLLRVFGRSGIRVLFASDVRDPRHRMRLAMFFYRLAGDGGHVEGRTSVNKRALLLSAPGNDEGSPL